MAKVIIVILLAVLCLFFFSFAMFDDNPQPRPEVGSMSYMMGISGIGIALCIGALYWFYKKGNRPKQ
jgi:NADH:ubiquinone oxidoreductase subunit 6 (subunit J)